MNDESPRLSDEATKLASLVNERLASLSRALDHDEDWKTWLELAQNARDAPH